MYTLHKVLTNPFNDHNISIAALAAFATDHIGKMTAKSPGSTFTARIAATSAALTAVDTAFATDLGKLGQRKTSKQAKDAFRATLPAAISKIYAVLIAKYGEHSVELAQFFPNGRSGLARTSDDLLGSALQQLVTALTGKQTELGAEVVPQATALLSGWNAVYVPSESSGDAKSASKDAKNAARAALQKELYLNLLTIGLQFPDQPERLSAYMQPSLLDPHMPSVPATSTATTVVPVLTRDANGKWTCTCGSPTTPIWQIWVSSSSSPAWSNSGEKSNSDLPAQDADIVPDGETWWQVKICGEDGDGKQATPFSNIISFGPVPPLA
jgi:hypothetical protein